MATVLADGPATEDAGTSREGFGTIVVLTSVLVLSYTAILVGRGVLWLTPAAAIALIFRTRIVTIRVSALLVAFSGWLILSAALAGLHRGTFMMFLLVGAMSAGAAAGAFSFTTVGRAMLVGVAIPLVLSVVASASGLASAREHGALYAGAWRGIFNQKNSLGFTAALAILLCVTQHRHLPRLHARALLLIATLGLIGSRSVSAIGALAFSLALYAIVTTMKRRRGTAPSAKVVLAVAVLLGLAVAVLLPRVIGDFGRDPTLTGRTVMWPLFWHDAHKQLLTGYGAGAYWSSATAHPALATIQQTLHFLPGQAHNGALDAVLDAGLVGLVLLTLLAVTAIRRALSVYEAGCEWPLFVVTFGLMMTFTERGLYSAPLLFIVAFIVSAPVVGSEQSG